MQLNKSALRRMTLTSTNIDNMQLTSPVVRTTYMLSDANVQALLSKQSKFDIQRI
ncbi:hypothetical protein QQZ08_010769 [Neonectria magnoliae]|uniref:Uncharacterized protein n=1 Tax=Neonectria magnoliae TaxID=2732573 RepID=A0ABR1HEQ7_9HYPO